jgi:hypothetical protein
VWDGVFSKGRQALELVSALSGPLGLLGNAARGLQRIARFQGLMQKAESLTFGVKKAVDLAGIAKDVKDAAHNVTDKLSMRPSYKPGAEDILLEACRQMQLTADRAGLVLCCNIKAAIRAMFLTSAHYAPELQTAERFTLTHALMQMDTQGRLLHFELALRAAALCAFYLSDDFETLTSALLTE